MRLHLRDLRLANDELHFRTIYRKQQYENKHNFFSNSWNFKPEGERTGMQIVPTGPDALQCCVASASFFPQHFVDPVYCLVPGPSGSYMQTLTFKHGVGFFDLMQQCSDAVTVRPALHVSGNLIHTV